MKILVAMLLVVIAQSASSACSVVVNAGGALSVFSTFIFPSSAGTFTVTNDSPGTHTLSIPAVTRLLQPVQGVDISGYAQLNISVVSGPNAGMVFQGDDSSGRTAVLANAGTDVIDISVQGNLNGTARAGSYDIAVPINCI